MDNNTAPTTKRLIASWTLTQDPATDEPVQVRWEDGTSATREDFSRILTHTQSDPYIVEGQWVEFGFDVPPSRREIIRAEFEAAAALDEAAIGDSLSTERFANLGDWQEALQAAPRPACDAVCAKYGRDAVSEAIS